jgi:hypothetical protein
MSCTLLKKALYDSDRMAVQKKDAAADLAANLVRVLEAQRRLGRTTYPLPLRRLAELTEPTASLELLQAALRRKPFKDRVVCGHTGHLDAPVALVEDMEQLAGSTLLLEFLLEQVCTPASPTCAVTALKTKLPTKLKRPFEAAVNRRIAENMLPESVAIVQVKKKPHVHLRRYELPRPLEVHLAENLVYVLKAQRALGDGAYPLLLGRLVELTQPEAPEGLTAMAVAQPAFKQAVVLGLRGKDSLKSPVALTEDSRLLAESTLLLMTAIKEARSDNSQIVTVAKLKAKVAPDIRSLVESAIRQRIQTRSFPLTVGCLIQNKQPVLFLTSDVVTGRAGSSLSPPPAPSLPSVPSSLSSSWGSMGQEGARVGRMSPEGSAEDFARQFDEAFRRLEQHARTANYVSLLQLRKALAAYDRPTFDAELRKLRGIRRYTLSAAEGRQGITPEEQEAGIVEDGALLLYVSRKLS